MSDVLMVVIAALCVASMLWGYAVMYQHGYEKGYSYATATHERAVVLNA